MKYSIFLFLIISMFTSCSKHYYIKPDCIESQRMVYVKGNELIVSEKRHKVTIGPYEDIDNNQVKMIISVKNNTDEEITVGIEDIKAISSENSPIKVFRYEELKKKLKYDNFMRRLANGLDAISQSQNSYNNNLGVSIANNQAEDIYARELAELDKYYLRKETILPGGKYFGIFIIDLPKFRNDPEKIHLELTLTESDPPHLLTFLFSKKEFNK